MAFIFAIAPVQIYYRISPFVKKKKIKSPTIVTTKDLVPVFKGFEEFKEANYIVSDVPPTLITRNTKRKLIGNIIKTKIEYKKRFSRIRNEDIYVFFTAWAIVYFYFLKKLSKNNRITFLLPRESYGELRVYMHKKDTRFRATVMKLIAKLSLGMDVEILNKAGQPAWELVRNSFSTEIVNYNPPKKLHKISDQKMLEGKEVLFLSQEFDDGGDVESATKITNELMDILEGNFEGKYLLKAHPRDGRFYGKMVASPHNLSQHILAETLMKHPWKYVVRYYSESLLAAKRHTKAKVISLLYLWKWGDQDAKQYWIGEYKKQDILTPKNVEELKEMLLGE